MHELVSDGIPGNKNINRNISDGIFVFLVLLWSLFSSRSDFFNVCFVSVRSYFFKHKVSKVPILEALCHYQP